MVIPESFVFALASVFVVSLISLIGVISLSMSARRLQTVLIYLISFSAGALFGDAFIHLLPELVEESGFTLQTSFLVLGGIFMFFMLEKVINWQHCHRHVLEEEHIHPFAYTNLVGDALHNLLDGIIIGTSYLISLPAGLATTIAVAFHEIPQEIGDFGVLIHGGFSKGKALLLNFASALIAVVGVVVTFILQDAVENIELFLIPIAAGGFIYIAGSDLIPELHKDSNRLGRAILQLLAFLAGIGMMALLLLLE